MSSLINQAMFGDYNTQLQVLNDPNITVDILKALANNAKDDSIYLKILDNSLLNEEIIEIVYEKTNNKEVIKKIIDSPYFTLYIYNNILENILPIDTDDDLKILDKVFQTKYTTERVLHFFLQKW